MKRWNVGRHLAMWMVACWLLFEGPSIEASLIVVTGAQNSESVLFEVDPTTGSVVREIGTTGLDSVTGIAFHPVTGELFAHQNVRGTGLNPDGGNLYRINPATADAELIGATGELITDLTFTPDGTLLGWVGLSFGDSGGASLFDLVTIDTANGALTRAGDSGVFPTNRAGLGSHPDGRLFLTIGDQTDPANVPGSLLTVDQITGQASVTQRLNALATNALTFDDQGNAFSINLSADGAILQTIDLNDGTVTEVGNLGALPISSLAFSVTAVPEPSTALLVAGAVACWLVRGTRHRRALASKLRGSELPS